MCGRGVLVSRGGDGVTLPSIDRIETLDRFDFRQPLESRLHLVALDLDDHAPYSTGAPEKLRHRAVGEQASLIDQQDALAGGLHLLHDVGAQQDRAVLAEGP